MPSESHNNYKIYNLVCRLTSGIDNILLHYVNLSPGRGALICPTYATPPGPIQCELLATFRQTCLSIRRVLRGRVAEGVECEESESESEDDWSDDDEWIDETQVKTKEERSPFSPMASSVFEHGILLQCTPSSPDKHKKQATPTLRYWVVG